MNAWTFVTAAYGIALIATLGLAGWSYAAMRRDEAEAEALGKPQ